MGSVFVIFVSLYPRLNIESHTPTIQAFKPPSTPSANTSEVLADAENTADKRHITDNIYSTF